MTFSIGGHDKIAIVGATSGLGSETAKFLYSNGWNLKLIGNNEDRLDLVTKEIRDATSKNVTKIDSHQINLLDEYGVNQAYEICKDCDIVINFVGIGLSGESFEMDLEKVSNMLDLNIIKTTLLTLRLSKIFAQRGYGKIINTASLAALHPVPYFNMYAASKAYLLSFGLALQHEMQAKGVQIITLCPGGLKTEFHLKSGLKDEIVRDNKKYVTEPIVWARKIEKIIKSGKKSKYVLPKEILYTYLVKFLPSIFFISISGTIYKKYLDSPSRVT